MNVKLSSGFLKKLKKIDVRIRKSFKERIIVFSKDPSDPQLDNHPLKREWKGHRSIDITADYRAIYKETQIGDENVAYFVALGTHDELYRRKS